MGINGKQPEVTTSDHKWPDVLNMQKPCEQPANSMGMNDKQPKVTTSHHKQSEALNMCHVLKNFRV